MKDLERTSKQAGTYVRPVDQQGTKIISNLVGEIYNKENDPQEKTDVQRSWLPLEDPALTVAMSKTAKKIPQANFFDNANSLPLGEGWQLAMYHNNDKPGAFGRKGTDVTKIANQTITRK